MPARRSCVVLDGIILAVMNREFDVTITNTGNTLGPSGVMTGVAGTRDHTALGPPRNTAADPMGSSANTAAALSRSSSGTTSASHTN